MTAVNTMLMNLENEIASLFWHASVISCFINLGISLKRLFNPPSEEISLCKKLSEKECKLLKRRRLYKQKQVVEFLYSIKVLNDNLNSQERSKKAHRIISTLALFLDFTSQVLNLSTSTLSRNIFLLNFFTE